MAGDAMRIESREELIYLVSEAAEIEHGVLCSYLFAAFTMKSSLDEGLTEQQLDAVNRWRGTILHIAAQEMVHLTLVCNMLTAIGAAPQLRRPNAPAGTHYYPEGFALALTPFNEQTLQHFIFIERPEGMDVPDGIVYQTFEHAAEPPVITSDVTAAPRAFATIGELYHGLEQGFRHLAEKMGEDRLFIGPQQAQAAKQYFSFPELIAVTDLASAVQAIEIIVEEGEGARGDWEKSHYGQFLKIHQEYDELKAADPSFEPGRPVLANPFTRRPGDAQQANIIDDPYSVEVCDLFDDSYEVVLQILARFFSHTEESPAELKALADVSVDAMFVAIKPLGDLITTLPAGPSHPGLNAGPGFHFFRTMHALPHRHAAWAIFIERLGELSAYAAELGARPEALPHAPPVLAEVSTALEALAGRLAAALEPGD